MSKQKNENLRTDTTKAKATARPWRTKKQPRIMRDGDFAHDIFSGKDKTYECVGTFSQASSRDLEEANFNAALIVQAVNEYEALKKTESAFILLLGHYQDLAKSNPGFISCLTLQDYALMNEALVACEQVMSPSELAAKLKEVRGE